MTEKPDTNNIKAVTVGRKLSWLGLASLIIAVVAIPFYCVSIYRVNSFNKTHTDVCVVGDTPFYNTIHTLCGVLPAASVTCAVLSFLRCRRSRSRFTAAIPALAGLLVAVVSLTIYILVLLALAGRQYH